MSYCRFSSDDFRCDLYLYQDVPGGYSLHVASRRPIGEIPRVPDILTSDPEEWVAAHRAQHDFLRSCEWRPIGLGYDGLYLRLRDLDQVLRMVRKLTAVGYCVPERVIPELEEDARSAGAADLQANAREQEQENEQEGAKTSTPEALGAEPSARA